jgi:cysteine-rich repeat protein
LQLLGVVLTNLWRDMNARTTFPFLALFLLAVAFPLAGCGGGSTENPFALCGNGHLDPGEQCDDGNLLDNDDCLSTCVLASCDDPFGTCNGSDPALRGSM